MRFTVSLVVVAATLLAAASAQAKTPFAGIHAHRGGALSGGGATHHENSLEAFKAAHELGADVIELDVKLTSDNVPVIMHDDSLDRTTNCTGLVRQKTAADLAACAIDVVGTGSATLPAQQTVAVPTMAEVLAWAKADKVKLNLEIKNLPTDADFDPTPGYADTILNGIDASGIPKAQVLVQSFLPANLDRAKPRGFQTSLLLLQAGANQQGIDAAKNGGYTVVSPGWPPQGDATKGKAFVDAAHAAGKPVVPYTLDTKADIQGAIDAGVDAIITNDPKLGLTLFYRPACNKAKSLEKSALKKYRKATGDARTKAKKTLAKARAKRKAACARVPK